MGCGVGRGRAGVVVNEIDFLLFRCDHGWGGDNTLFGSLRRRPKRVAAALLPSTTWPSSSPSRSAPPANEAGLFPHCARALRSATHVVPIFKNPVHRRNGTMERLADAQADDAKQDVAAA